MRWSWLRAMACTSPFTRSSSASTPRSWALFRSRPSRMATPRKASSTSAGMKGSARRRTLGLLDLVVLSVLAGTYAGQPHGEAGAAPRGIVEADGPTHPLHELGDHGEPDPHAAGLEHGVARAAVEAGEVPRPLLGRDARPLVADDDGGATLLGPHGHGHGRPRG